MATLCSYHVYSYYCCSIVRLYAIPGTRYRKYNFEPLWNTYFARWAKITTTVACIIKSRTVEYGTIVSRRQNFRSNIPVVQQ